MYMITFAHIMRNKRVMATLHLTFSFQGLSHTRPKHQHDQASSQFSNTLSRPTLK